MKTELLHQILNLMVLEKEGQVLPHMVEVTEAMEEYTVEEVDADLDVPLMLQEDQDILDMVVEEAEDTEEMAETANMANAEEEAEDTEEMAVRTEEAEDTEEMVHMAVADTE